MIVISNTSWIGENLPCLTVGMRGMITVSLEVSGHVGSVYTLKNLFRTRAIRVSARAAYTFVKTLCIFMIVRTIGALSPALSPPRLIRFLLFFASRPGRSPAYKRCRARCGTCTAAMTGVSSTSPWPTWSRC